jgi:two-component system sensor histidine kinase UhpB
LTAHKIEANWYDETDLAALEAFGSHAALAIQNAELWEEIKAVSARYVDALEQERRRISRELHDEVGQALTAAKISLEMILRELPAEFTTLRSRLQGVVALASETLNDVRRLAYELRPTVLDDLGLVHALQWYTDTFSRGTGLSVTFRADDLAERPSSEVETVLYRLVQEGLTNVARHAHAQHVEVELTTEPGVICLRISDDGCGFDSDELTKPWSPGQGLGLRGMRERVTLLGGTLEVNSEPGQGTELLSKVPLNGPVE